MFLWTLCLIKLNDGNTQIVFLHFLEILNKKTPESGWFKSFFDQLLFCAFR